MIQNYHEKLSKKLNFVQENEFYPKQTKQWHYNTPNSKSWNPVLLLHVPFNSARW
jgi:hypothetical protein